MGYKYQQKLPSVDDVLPMVTLSDGEKAFLREIVREEVQRVMPLSQKKPEVGLPTCPDCGGWELGGHDGLTPLDTMYRSWWCVCPEKVEKWEESRRHAAERIQAAIIDDPENQVEAVLLELEAAEFEDIVRRVREKKERMGEQAT